MNPKIVAWSPAWKLTTVLQVTPPPRPSTKNVSKPPSEPSAPDRKLDPSPPSSTFVPEETASASSPGPPFRKTLGTAARIATPSLPGHRYWYCSDWTGPV